MSLIVETGTASATSEAFASVAYCDTYHDKIGNILWSTLTTTDKESALRRATKFMQQFYRMQWKGTRVLSTQALDWPRYDVQVPDLGYLNVIYPDTVPDLVVQANAELALLAAGGDLNPNLSQAVTSVTVGPIKKTYDPTSPQQKRYVFITDILRPLLQSPSSANVKLRRT